MKLSEMREILGTRGIQLTRSLGQNFLHDGNQLRRIVAQAELSPGDRVLEVGPGLGPLTEHLLAAGADVLAIEKDARLVAVLAERFGVASDESAYHPAPPHPALSPGGGEGARRAGEGVVQGSQARTCSESSSHEPRWGSAVSSAPDFLGACPAGGLGETRPTGSLPAERGHSCPPPAPGGRLHLMHADALRVLAERPHDWSGWKLVANLPYSVASPILVELATAEYPPERLVATLQLEVVRRLMAGPGTKDYGVLTLLVQLRYEPRGSFKIPADCFFPAPDVDSGCITLVRRSGDALDAAGRRVFARVVKRAFSERRKKALKLLKFDWPAAVLETAWAELGLDVMARAEDLGREHFVALTRRLLPAGAPPSDPALESLDPPP